MHGRLWGSMSASMEGGEGSCVRVGAGVWGSDSYTAGNGSKQLRACEPEAVPYLCCSLSAPCTEQGSKSYSNAERRLV